MIVPTRDSQGIVLYDFFRVLGGAERVAADLVRHYQADLALGFDALEEQSLSFDDEVPTHKFDFKASSNFLPVQVMRLVYSFYYKVQFLNKYDWAVYSGVYAPLAVRHQSRGKRILYCHTPPRFLYDLKDYYKKQNISWRKPLFHCFSSVFKPLYENAFHSMDVVIANSENVKKRIKHYLGAESVVIHPPCSVEGKEWGEPQGYYLSLARLEPYKRVDRLIEAFLRMPNKRLVIASGGSDLGRLKELAQGAENIHFTGWTSQAKLDQLISNCIASLYIPIDEDFGMSPVESMAAGKPVIGVNEGGLGETVLPDETGILLNSELRKEDIVEAVNRMSPQVAVLMKTACEERAKLFSEQEFFRKMDRYLS